MGKFRAPAPGSSFQIVDYLERNFVLFLYIHASTTFLAKGKEQIIDKCEIFETF